MKIRITNLTAELADTRAIEEIVAARLKIDTTRIRGVKIVRKAVDARRYRGAGIRFNFIVDVEVAGNFKLGKDGGVTRAPAEKIFRRTVIPKTFRAKNPIVVGFGPAGIFAALELARAGLEPIIFERGGDVDARTAAVEKFFRTGGLDGDSNVQFGEGGAGTFSDGKLTTRLNDELIDYVLGVFVEAGAPAEIAYLHKPHIGTDNLRRVVKNIRRRIIELGGRIHFDATVTDFEFDAGGNVTAVVVGGAERIAADAVFVGIGHSARDTYEMLSGRGVAMESKAFAIGVRIEHAQEFINRAQYGVDFDNPALPAADYLLTHKGANRGAYSFCMCPGGQVVAATSESGRVVTNGMSNFARDSGVANSALLVTVGAADFKNFGGDVLSGVRFQRHFESLAFKIGGGDYRAPVQSVGDFLSGRATSKNFAVTPTYPLGYRITNLSDALPAEVAETLKAALIFWNDRIENFAADDIPLTGIETRTSAPCRILRDKISRQSISHGGIYPIGEGAGYAGGITSSAIDGVKSAQIFIDSLTIGGG